MSASSAEMSAPVVDAFEAGAVLGAAEFEAAELAGAGVLELELDEQAASSRARQTAAQHAATVLPRRCPQCGRRFANRNQTHSCGRHDLAPHFAGKGRAVRELFDALLGLLRGFGPVTVLPEKTRIAFQVRMSFAAVSIRKDTCGLGNIRVMRSACSTRKRSRSKSGRSRFRGPVLTTPSMRRSMIRPGRLRS